MDPRGHWPTPEHGYITDRSFVTVGFYGWMAREAATYSMRVDFVTSGMSPIPLLGRQSMHYNDSDYEWGSRRDTRMVWRDVYFARAYSAVERRDAVGALQEFGTGLHPPQDSFAHLDKYVFRILGAWVHGFSADDKRVEPWRYSATESMTLNAARDLYNVMGQRGLITVYDPRDTESARAIEGCYQPGWYFGDSSRNNAGALQGLFSTSTTSWSSSSFAGQSYFSAEATSAPESLPQAPYEDWP